MRAITRRLASERRTDEVGAGLLETLIALAIGSMALIALLGAISTGILGVARNNVRVHAANLAMDQLEGIKGVDYNCTVAGTTPGAYPTVTVEEPGMAITVTAAPITTSLQIITVTVSHYGQEILTVEDVKRCRLPSCPCP